MSPRPSNHQPPGDRPPRRPPIPPKSFTPPPDLPPNLPKLPLGPRVPTGKANRHRPVPSIYAPPPPPRFHQAAAAQPPPVDSPQATPTATQVVSKPVPKATADAPRRKSFGPLTLLGWLTSWQFVLLTTVGLVSGAIAFAAISLFRIPNLPNCRAIFWPTASAAVRLQCAESYANQGTVDHLLEAIDLVDDLPQDHPLRADIDARIEVWAEEILNLADQSFDEGELDRAIATARKIPANTAAADLVEGRIRQWRKIWDEASEIYESAKAQLVELEFQAAFSLAVQLLDVPNDYWQKTKYNELTRLIVLAREDSGKLGKVKQLAAQGTAESFREALELLASISPDSVLYDTAKTARKTLVQDMLKVAENALERQRLNQAEAILAAIPRDAGLNQEVADFQVFVDAYKRAWAGDALGLDAAITRLQSIDKNRPLYDRAQNLIGRWRGELRALAKLDEARQIAASGSTDDLRRAIAQAQQISRSSPRWDEASRQIGRWQEQVQTVEDQPILSRADQLANPGTPEALRAAIAEANRIGSGRALYSQARSRIGGWTSRLQQMEDQPILARARQQAAGGDLDGAIATASQIGSGRALYSEAQGDLADWRRQNQTRTWLSQANQAAASGTPNGLANAISIAGQVPQSSGSYGDAQGRINRWSWALLNQAEAFARTDPARAAALAEQIPARSEAYSAAQERVRDWRSTPVPTELELAPAAPPTEAPEEDPF